MLLTSFIFHSMLLVSWKDTKECQIRTYDEKEDIFMSNIDLLKLQSLLDDHRHYLLQGYNVVSNPYLRTEDIQMSNTILDKDKLNEKFPGNSFYNYVSGNETGSIS